MLKLHDLSIEYKTAPLGLDEVQPRFSWKLESDRNNTRQTAYRITVSNRESMWDTGRVESEQSILVEYMGALFEARTAYTWTVTVWDNHGESCEASAQFETGLLSGAAFEGRARWITHGLPKDDTASPVFTKNFTVSRPVAKARLYATALGLYEAEINGEKVDDTFLPPAGQATTSGFSTRPAQSKRCARAKTACASHSARAGTPARWASRRPRTTTATRPPCSPC